MITKRIYSFIITILLSIQFIACQNELTITPTFYLLGNSVIYLDNGEEFVEPGFIATTDTDISNQVIIISTLDIYTTGEYTIQYILEIDSIEYTLERTVHVGEILVRYFNQTDPGLIPKIFAEGIISTNLTSEFSGTFSPDYQYFFFTRRNTYNDNRIFYSAFQNGEWSMPSLSPISEDITEFEPHITPDGKYLYFGSKRNNFSSLVIFRSDLQDGMWSDPQFVDNGINEAFAMYVSVANSKNLYYTSTNGIYVMNYVDGEYLPGVYTGIQGAHSYIAPDESYILFDDSGTDVESTSIYISYNLNGVWGDPIKLPESINQTDSNQICSMISPDGLYLFFSRFTAGRADIYWVSIDILKRT